MFPLPVSVDVNIELIELMVLELPLVSFLDGRVLIGLGMSLLGAMGLVSVVGGFEAVREGGRLVLSVVGGLEVGGLEAVREGERVGTLDVL